MVRLSRSQSNVEKEEKITRGELGHRPQKKNLYLSDEQLQILPENDEEEKEILVTDQTIQADKAKRKGTLTKTSKNRQDEASSLTGVVRLVQRQTLQVNKITKLVRSVRRDISSLQAGPKSIRKTSYEIEKIKDQVTKIQKQLGRKGFTQKGSSS